MICREVIDIIERRYPREYALGWDNVGLLAGRDDKEVGCIYIALDASDEVIHAAVEQEADMLITHHPLIFSGMKRITNEDFIGRRVLEQLRSDVSYYAMHTNYDVMGMASRSGDLMGLKEPEVLEVTYEDRAEKTEGIGRIGRLEKAVTLRQCCERVKQTFGLGSVRVFGDPERMVERLAICPGSGKSVIKAALRKHADVLVTGDIGHHEGIDAKAQGLAVIDAGHYGLEYIFAEDMRGYLAHELEGVRVMAAPVRHPFVTV